MLFVIALCKKNFFFWQLQLFFFVVVKEELGSTFWVSIEKIFGKGMEREILLKDRNC